MQVQIHTAVVPADSSLHKVLHPVFDNTVVATSKVMCLLPIVNDLETVTRSRVGIRQDLVAHKLDVTLDLALLLQPMPLISSRAASKQCTVRLTLGPFK